LNGRSMKLVQDNLKKGYVAIIHHSNLFQELKDNLVNSNKEYH